MNTDVADYGSDGGGKDPAPLPYDQNFDLQFKKCVSILEQLKQYCKETFCDFADEFTTYLQRFIDDTVKSEINDDGYIRPGLVHMDKTFFGPVILLWRRYLMCLENALEVICYNMEDNFILEPLGQPYERIDSVFESFENNVQGIC